MTIIVILRSLTHTPTHTLAQTLTLQEDINLLSKGKGHESKFILYLPKYYTSLIWGRGSPPDFTLSDPNFLNLTLRGIICKPSHCEEWLVQGKQNPLFLLNCTVPYFPVISFRSSACSPHVTESRFRNPQTFCLWNMESGKIFVVESGIIGFGIQNTAPLIWNPTISR